MPFRTLRIVVLGLVVLYTAPYAILSWQGDYYWGQSGELRWNFGLALSDIAIWQPAVARWQLSFKTIRGEYQSRGNFLGYLYSPLIWLERQTIKPTITLVTAEDLELDSAEPSKDVHPADLKEEKK